ncbi:ComEC/Rec2 family competence protein [Flavobacterium sp.]|jgi:competence protein ComEC|uniref:ComEC/Rec2 family competence protein n=1 Tax=Flavobacterium sp. TaxID=239 RepID=UPI0037C10995
MKVIKFPTIVITICLILGILISNKIKPDVHLALLIVLVALVPFFVFYFLIRKNLKFRISFGISSYALAFTIGIFLFAIHYPKNQASHYSNSAYQSAEKNLVSGIISEKLKPNQYSFKYFLEVESINERASKGKLLVILNKKDAEKEFEIGDKILANAIIKPIIRPHNPYQFDYAAYLEKKDVFDQLYLENQNYKVIAKQENLNFQLEKTRNKVVAFFENENITTERINIIKALFLGQRQNIEQETLDNYSKSGAIHILAISGLHIGILLYFFKALLKPIEHIRYGRVITPFLLIIILWSFALLSGLSASVVRAVTMFTFVSIGMYMNRETNIYNTLGSSILILLLFKPNFIFDVGFQLSYCAVFSIVTIQPLLSKLWTPKNKIIGYFYDILTVSFAAQIGVLPLSIYYFHQFPGLFFITNLVIIPSLTLILITGMVSILLSALGIYFTLLVEFLSGLIGFMNGYVRYVSSYEQFIIKDIPFNFSILLCSLLTIICIILYIKKPTFKGSIITLTTLLIFQTSIIGSLAFHKNQNEFIIFQYPKKTILASKVNNSITLHSNDSLVNSNYVVKNYIQNNFGTIDSITRLQNVYLIHQTKLLVIDERGIYKLPKKPEVVLLTQSPKINFERLITEINPKIIIADGSNYKTLIEKWERTCRQKNIPFHSTSEKGYYRISLD